MLKSFVFLLLLMSLNSCGSLYNSLGIKDVHKIQILKYEHFYEQHTVSEVVLNDKNDIKPVLLYLRILSSNGRIREEFKNFDTSRIVINVISKDQIISLQIIGDRLEVDESYYYKKLIYREKKFIELIKSY